MVALGETWRNLSPEEKLVYNNQAKVVFQVKTTTCLEKDDIKLQDNSSRNKDKSAEEEDKTSQKSEEENDHIMIPDNSRKDDLKSAEKEDKTSQKTVEEEDKLGKCNEHEVESESDSNEEISDSSEDPEDVN